MATKQTAVQSAGSIGRGHYSHYPQGLIGGETVDVPLAHIRAMNAQIEELTSKLAGVQAVAPASFPAEAPPVTIEDAVVEKMIKEMRQVRGTVVGRPLIEQQVHYLSTIVFGAKFDEWAYRDMFPVQVVYHDKEKDSTDGGLAAPKVGAISIVYTGGDTLAVFKLPKPEMDTHTANAIMAWLLLMPSEKPTGDIGEKQP